MPARLPTEPPAPPAKKPPAKAAKKAPAKKAPAKAAKKAPAKKAAKKAASEEGAAEEGAEPASKLADTNGDLHIGRERGCGASEIHCRERTQPRRGSGPDAVDRTRAVAAADRRRHRRRCAGDPAWCCLRAGTPTTE